MEGPPYPHSFDCSNMLNLAMKEGELAPLDFCLTSLLGHLFEDMAFDNLE